MRITGGDLGGRRLVTPKNQATRPTADATRETLFNILQNGMGAEFSVALDIFAGSGSVAFEALSRGAERAVLIESDRAALVAIARNAEDLNLQSRVQVIPESSMEKWPGQLRKALLKQKVDLVFADPPYEKGLGARSLALLTKRVPEIFATKCHWVMELRRTEPLPPTPEGWELVKERESGAAKLVIYRRLESPEVG